jgi:hypothetical protein
MMTVKWRGVRGAVGYNVRWGVRPDRLNLCYQVFARPGDAGNVRLDIRALSAGVDYFVTVETFDESGVSPPGRIVTVR